MADMPQFAEPSLLILVSLSDGPKHGYAIMADAEELTGSPLGPGTLYAALARLERRGLIEALPADDRRRPYRITAVGAATLRAQLHDLRGFVRLASAWATPASPAAARTRPRAPLLSCHGVEVSANLRPCTARM